MQNYNEYNLDFCEKKVIPIIKKVVDKFINESYEVEKKGHGNFVTSIDLAIENELKTELHYLIEDAGMITEESESEEASLLNWVIDPIDGTTNFIYGLPYAVSVALVKQKENSILGVVYNPPMNTVYYACKGQGSYILKNNKKRKIYVADFGENEGIALFGMPYDRNKADRILDIAKQIYNFSSDLKRIGPSSLDICLVAEGKAKLYVEFDLKIWDISAGIIILTEAGGSYEQYDDLFLFGSLNVIDQCKELLSGHPFF